MHDGGGGGGGSAGGHHGGPAAGGHSGSGHSGSGHSGGAHSRGGHSGGGRESSGAGVFGPSGQRAPSRDSLDPLGPMSMPKIVGRLAERAGRGQQGAGTFASWLFVISVLAIIIAFGVFFIAGGH
jgi:hypothetical protein